MAVVGVISLVAGACADGDDQAVDTGTDDGSPVVELPTEEAPTTDGAASAEQDAAPQEPQPEATSDSQSEFLDLGFWSGFNGDFYEIERFEECDTSTPDRQVCEFSAGGTLTASHLGVARDEESGTITIHLDEPCTMGSGTDGNFVVVNAEGTMTTAAGDEAYFTLRNTYCGGLIPDPGTALAYWVIDGGTGRFEEAYGVMASSFWPGDEYTTVSVGNLRVRADLWADLIPSEGPGSAAPRDAG